MNGKILVALQMWSGDRTQCMNLSKFLADIEPKHSDLADFLLVHRFDCNPPTDVMPKLSRKFNTFVYKTPNCDTGWPLGCNAVTYHTMEWVRCMKEANKVPDYKAIFLCEGDGAPVFVNWIEKMHAAWDAVNAKGPVLQAGPYMPPPTEHINGNCLMNGSIGALRWFCNRKWQTKAGGWDWVGYEEFKKHGAVNIPGMKNLYAKTSFTEAEWQKLREEDVIWCHGDKANDLLYWGSKHFLGKTIQRFKVVIKGDKQ